MSKNKTLLLVAGFLLFLYGFLAIILQFVGIQFTFLAWIDAAGSLLGFVIRLLMVIAGIIMAFWARTDFDAEND
jgi:hypothetical protein